MIVYITSRVYRESYRIEIMWVFSSSTGCSSCHYLHVLWSATMILLTHSIPAMPVSELLEPLSMVDYQVIEYYVTSCDTTSPMIFADYCPWTQSTCPIIFH